jgi:hypothetical protein
MPIDTVRYYLGLPPIPCAKRVIRIGIDVPSDAIVQKLSKLIFQEPR